MTKKDYELIARVLLESKEYLQEMKHWVLVHNMADELKKTNPLFDSVKFFQACGFEVK